VITAIGGEITGKFHRFTLQVSAISRRLRKKKARRVGPRRALERFELESKRFGGDYGFDRRIDRGY
jgi:hypothetical protein